MFHLADAQLKLLDFHNSLSFTLCNLASNVIFQICYFGFEHNKQELPH